MILSQRRARVLAPIGQRPALAVIATETAGPVPHREHAVDIAPDGDAPAGPAGPAGLLGQLQGEVVQGDHIVFAHGALVLLAEDGVEVHAVQGHEGARGVGGGPRELLVVVGEKALHQVGIGGGERGDAREVQLVDEAPLHRAVEALAAAAGLRGIGPDVLDAEAVEGPADLRAVGAINGAAGF